MLDPLAALAADPCLSDDQGWAALTAARSDDVNADVLFAALADPTVAARLPVEFMLGVADRVRRHLPAAGNLPSVPRPAGGHTVDDLSAHRFLAELAALRPEDLPAPRSVAQQVSELVADVAAAATTSVSAKPGLATLVQCKLLRDSGASGEVLGAAALELLDAGSLALFDLGRTGVDRRVNVDVAAGVLTELPLPALRMVFAAADPESGSAADLEPTSAVSLDPRCSLVVGAAAVIAVAAAASSTLTASALAGLGLSTRFASDVLRFAVALDDDYVAADEAGVAPYRGERVAPGALVQLCARFAAANGVALVGDVSVTSIVCGADPSATVTDRVLVAWFAIRDHTDLVTPTAAALAVVASFVSAVTGGGCRRVALPDLDVGPLLTSGAVSPVTLFAAVDYDTPAAVFAAAAGLCEPAVPWDVSVLAAALDAHPDLDSCVCAALPKAAAGVQPDGSIGQPSPVAVPGWLRGRSQRSTGLAAWVSAVPEARAELAAAAAGIGASRWSVLVSLLGDFRGTPEELVAITDVAAPPT